jgi:release factor glutamine methyltransferase
MRPSEVIRRSAEYLERHGVESPREEAEAILMNLLGTSRARLYSRAEGLDLPTARRFGRALCRRCKGVPLQYLTGEQPFADLTLRVEPGVFVPRPETEGLAIVALGLLEGRPRPVVVDVGTGAGAIALFVKHHRADARVLATDLSADAVRLARSNSSRLGLDVDVREGDLLDPVPDGLRGQIDLIVSNPPYVTVEEYESLPVEVRAEPYAALVGGTDVHRHLVEAAGEWLRPGGWLVVEIGADQGGDVRSLFESRFTDVSVHTDLAGRDRVVQGRRGAP